MFLAAALAEPPAAHAGLRCPDDPRAAALQAKAVLERSGGAPSPAQHRATLICLAEAVAELSAKLDGLSKGSIPFEGQIHIPKGYVMQRPPEQEAN